MTDEELLGLLQQSPEYKRRNYPSLETVKIERVGVSRNGEIVCIREVFRSGGRQAWFVYIGGDDLVTDIVSMARFDTFFMVGTECFTSENGRWICVGSKDMDFNIYERI